ncbi:MAG: hypothetical protein ACP5LA_02820 [Thermoplasmata archaeon]
MKIKKLAFLSAIFAILLPTLVVATVVISYTYPISVSTNNVNVYLATGENYATANELGFMSINSVPSTSPVGTEIPNGETITINGASGSPGNTTLLNVLEIYNATSGSYTWNGGTLNLWINGTLPNGVTLYYSTSPITFGTPSGTSWISGTQYTLGSKLTLPPSTTLYLAFQINGGVTGSGHLYIQYSPT